MTSVSEAWRSIKTQLPSDLFVVAGSSSSLRPFQLTTISHTAHPPIHLLCSLALASQQSLSFHHPPYTYHDANNHEKSGWTSQEEGGLPVGVSFNHIHADRRWQSEEASSTAEPTIIQHHSCPRHDNHKEYGSPAGSWIRSGRKRCRPHCGRNLPHPRHPFVCRQFASGLQFLVGTRGHYLSQL